MVMTNIQLYLTIGLPTLAVLIGILANGMQINTLNARMTSVENRMTALETRVETRISALEAKIDTKFDLLVGKVIDVDNCLTRLEERLKH
jgi:hypothetical protein